MSKEGDEQRRPRRAPYSKPCEECRRLHRKCNPNCLLKRYFPHDDDEFEAKFTAVKKHFGHRNLEKKLLEQLRTQEQTKESFQGGLDQHFPSNINNTKAMPQNPQQVQNFNHQILGHTGDMDKLIGEFMAVQVELKYLSDLLRAQEQTEYFEARFHDLEDLQDVVRICPELSLDPPTTQLQHQNLQDRKSKRSSCAG